MKTKVSRCHSYPIGNARQYGRVLAVLFGFLIHANAHAFSLTVVSRRHALRGQGAGGELSASRIAAGRSSPCRPEAARMSGP